jgi:hypothetical protein
MWKWGHLFPPTPLAEQGFKNVTPTASLNVRGYSEAVSWLNERTKLPRPTNISDRLQSKARNARRNSLSS